MLNICKNTKKYFILYCSGYYLLQAPSLGDWCIIILYTVFAFAKLYGWKKRKILVCSWMNSRKLSSSFLQNICEHHVLKQNMFLQILFFPVWKQTNSFPRPLCVTGHHSESFGVLNALSNRVFQVWCAGSDNSFPWDHYLLKSDFYVILFVCPAPKNIVCDHYYM